MPSLRTRTLTLTFTYALTNPSFVYLTPSKQVVAVLTLDLLDKGRYESHLFHKPLMVQPLRGAGQSPQSLEPLGLLSELWGLISRRTVPLPVLTIRQGPAVEILSLEPSCTEEALLSKSC